MASIDVLTAEAYRSQRTGLRISIEKKIRKIDNIIKSKGSRTVIRYIEELRLKCFECFEVHHVLLDCLKADDPENDCAKEDVWLTEFLDVHELCSNRVAAYFETRRDDASSNCSRRSVASEASHHRMYFKYKSRLKHLIRQREEG